MIFDPEIELANIERQPEWIGVSQKIDELKRRRSELIKALIKFENDSTMKRIDEIDRDIQLFQNILSFWVMNYSKMDRLYKAFESQISEINRAADLLDQINDLREAYRYEVEENEILIDVL